MALKGVSAFFGDRQHLYYLLQDYGLSILQTLMVFSVLAVLGGAIGLSTHLAGFPDNRLFALLVLFGAAYFIGVRRLAKALSSSNAVKPDSADCSTVVR